ncbi:MAG: dephospho-CoA kinase [Gammaproteobacteria bacterium]
MLIGLTGGIGSGKTAAGKFFNELGIDVIDADDLAKQSILEGTKGSRTIINRYGQKILDDNKEIDRKKLRAIIFENPVEKVFVESVIHPEVTKGIYSFIENAKSPYKIIIVPLLFETDSQSRYDRVLLIDSTEESQLQRATKRDNVDVENIKAIMASQFSRDKKLMLADDVIANNNSLAKLKDSVVQTNEFYLSLCNG